MTKMKTIAYMITAYLSPESLLNLVTALDNDGADFFIHIDRKKDAAPFLSLLSRFENVYFLPDEKRVKVYWGGYSQIEMQYNLIKAILNSGVTYNRVVSLTGMDYPVASNEVLKEAFSDQEKEYIIGFDITKEEWGPSSPIKMSNKDRFLYYYRFDGNWNIARIIKKLRIRRYKTYESIGYDFYYGSEYWALTYDCIRDLIAEYDSDAALREVLKHSFVPSESWIHTLFFNSQYKDRGVVWKGDTDLGIGNYSPLTYFNYGKKIKILGEEDYEAITGSGRPFARKLENGVSDDLRSKLDRYREKESSYEQDFRYYRSLFGEV